MRGSLIFDEGFDDDCGYSAEVIGIEDIGSTLRKGFEVDSCPHFSAAKVIRYLSSLIIPHFLSFSLLSKDAENGESLNHNSSIHMQNGSR